MKKVFKKKPLEYLQKGAVFMVFFLFTCIVNAQSKGTWDYPGKPGLWDYPVKPGTEKWGLFQSHDEMVEVCQVPEDILSSISTEDLADLCLRYPMLTDFFAFQNTNEGLDKLFSNFNGIRELYNRQDVSSILTKKYIEKIQSFSFLDGPGSNLEKGFFVIRVSTLEVLLGRLVWQEREGKESPKDVMRALVAGYEAKLKYAEDFKGTGFITNFYSRTHVISKMEKSFVEQLPQKQDNSAFYSGMVDEQSIKVIDELSYQLIK